MDYCGTCEPRFFLGKDEITSSCMEPPGCQGKVYGGHCIDDDCVLMEEDGIVTNRCKQAGKECVLDYLNNIRCIAIPRKKDPKDEEEEEEVEGITII